MKEVKEVLKYLPIGSFSCGGFTQKTIAFITETQLKDKALWDKFVDVFGSGIDSKDNGWRGEYWGKMMRGACLVYAYTADEALYEIIRATVLALLDKQEENGRISTYVQEAEFYGWDMWARKYVMVGLEYFYRICKEAELREKVLIALQAHADYIIQHIGKDKKSIIETSQAHYGLNSCSILDAVLQLYRLTNEKRYLEFAEYIISFGGTGNGNLIQCVEEDVLEVAQFPVTKAYEMMSFFEGLLTYYECTGEERYLSLVVRFCEKIEKTELTIVGGLGWEEEYFSSSTVRQTEETDAPMLETCVTVTWIRILSRLLALTGKAKYADLIEQSTYNALYGALNFENLEQVCKAKKCRVKGLPFDSYSPLVQGRRGGWIAGYKEFLDGMYYGCCACIGAAGLALMPLGSVMTDKNVVVLNYYVNGVTSFTLSSGETVKLEICTSYPANGKVVLKITGNISQAITIRLRIPAWCKHAKISRKGQTVLGVNEYYTVECVENGEEIDIDFSMQVECVYLNGKTAFRRGPIVLARDEWKENRKIDFGQVYTLLKNNDGTPQIMELVAESDEYYRCEVHTTKNDSWLLTDYKSCGKKWTSDLTDISVWFRLD